MRRIYRLSGDGMHQLFMGVICHFDFGHQLRFVCICGFDLKFQERHKNNILHLVSSINNQMWLGHFDIWIDEGVVLYRNTSLFNRDKISQNQFDEVMVQAVASCDQFFPAFQYVLWANKSSSEALEAVLFSTQGEA